MMYLLDSSAWLVHLFGETSVEEINQLFDDADAEINICALSIPEVYGRLRAVGREDHWQQVWDVYAALFTKILPVDEIVARQAITLRASTPQRLPTIDGLIAATAAIHGGTLVHRDPHLVAIPNDLLRQIELPAK